jgi:hypothetical protein
MRLPRMTIRRWLLTVAFSAAAIEAYRRLNPWYVMRQTSWNLDCQLRALDHEIGERRYRGVATGYLESWGTAPKVDAERAAHHARLKREWKAAASRPWWLSRGFVDGDGPDLR